MYTLPDSCYNRFIETKQKVHKMTHQQRIAEYNARIARYARVYEESVARQAEVNATTERTMRFLENMRQAEAFRQQRLTRPEARA